MTDQIRVTVERDGHVPLIGMNRADNRNFFDFAMRRAQATRRRPATSWPRSSRGTTALATSIDDVAPFDYTRPVAAALVDQAISADGGI